MLDDIHRPVCVVIERATSVLFELEHAYSMILYGFTLTFRSDLLLTARGGSTSEQAHRVCLFAGLPG
jgi:hypothetical protein